MPQQSSPYRDIINILQSPQPLLLAGHEDPDCDSLGSLLGLYLAFDGAAKGWTLLRTGEAPANLSYLPQLELFTAPHSIDPAAYAGVLLVDCCQLPRSGSWMPGLAQGKPVYCIDHHEVSQPDGVINVIEPQAAAAGEIVAALCREAGVTLSDQAALCLYSAIAADTGGFRFRNTCPRCLLMAAHLLPQIDSELVRIRLFENRSWANMKMLAACLNQLQVECEGRLAYSWLSHAEMEKYQAGYNDCHNIVNQVLELNGVKVGLMFEEYEDQVKMSFRCREGYRVDELARQFGGGGHALAAGCKQEGGLAQVMPPVLAAARRLFAQNLIPPATGR